MTVRLRPAQREDEARLLEWRNEPTTRAASLASDAISAEAHAGWFARKLADPGCAIFIVMEGDEPLGQVRLDRLEDDLAEVSIGLAPAARGRGIGREALRRVAGQAEGLGVARLRALVKPENVASLRAFEAAGYDEFERSDDVVELRAAVVPTEESIDWGTEWRRSEVDVEAPAAEARTQRWRGQEQLVRERLGDFEGLKVIEIGAGRATNAVLYAQRGARTTVFDISPIALEQATEVFAAHGLEAETVEGDIFDLPSELLGRFDVAMSFGLSEHFLGEHRRQSIAAHVDLVRPGGLAFVSVPNRWSPVYRLWMAVEKRRGTWRLGTEEPFTVGELRSLAQAAGGTPLEPLFGSFTANVVGHGLNGVLRKLGRKPLPVPNPRLPGVDRLAYELLLPILRPT